MVKEKPVKTALDYMLDPANRTNPCLSRDEEKALSARIIYLRDELYNAVNTYGKNLIDNHFPEFRESEGEDNHNRWRFVNEIAILYMKKLKADADEIESDAFLPEYETEKSEPHKLKLPEIKIKSTEKKLAEYNRVSRLYTEWKAAREAFIGANIGLAVLIAKRKKATVDLEDAIQDALEYGISRALDSFDPTKGIRFSTYATWWTRQTVSRYGTYYGHAIKRPVHVQEKVNKINRVTQSLITKFGEAPIEKIASGTGYSVEQILELMQAPETVSINKSIGEEGRTFLDDTPDNQTEDAYTVSAKNQIKERIHQALSILTPREQDVIKLRFGLYQRADEMTLNEIGEKWNVTRERIRQLETGAINKLRKSEKAKKLLEGLL